MAEWSYLLDSSALLAVFQKEPGADKVEAVLNDAAIHAVQVAEVVKKFFDFGFTIPDAIHWLDELALPVIEGMTAGDAYLTGWFTEKGLSLGDRICLAAAHQLSLTAVTADRRWNTAANNPAGNPAVRVQLIR